MRSGEAVGLWQVGEKCDWVCLLCGISVDRELNPRDQMAASVDHVVPIAKDGEHILENLQLAHRICNSYKAANEWGWEDRLDMAIRIHRGEIAA